MTEGEKAAELRELSRSEIDAILARNHVGRIGYARQNKVEIRPVHYVYSGDWIYGRTAFGAKYEALVETAHEWWPVVFEVDEVDDLLNWRSVLVHGGFYAIRAEASPADREIWEHAIELLRTLFPSALGIDDPMPALTTLFRISVQEASGRELRYPGASAR